VHDKDYRNSQKDFETFVEKLTEKIIEKDDTIPELPVKDLVRHCLRGYSKTQLTQPHTVGYANISRHEIQFRSNTI
jgi:Conserved hypothetical protein (DUF2461)